MSTTQPLVVSGKVGLVDAALVRHLSRLHATTDLLYVSVTDSLYPELVTRDHLIESLGHISWVDAVVDPDQLAGEPLPLPEKELQQYSRERICKTARPAEPRGTNFTKLRTVRELIDQYGARPGQRNTTIALVSGVYDVIHLGHIRMFVEARRTADIVVVATMPGANIARQPKNTAGDRPIYDDEDRLTVLDALTCVDHIVVFDDLDCRSLLHSFCPDVFAKHIRDMDRDIVQAECRCVESSGGRVAVSTDPSPYSSTDLIDHVRKRYR